MQKENDSMVNLKDITVFIDPVTNHFQRNELFNPNSKYNLDNKHEPYFYLRQLFHSKGIEVHTGDYLMRNEKVNKINVYFSFGIVSNYKRLAKRRDTILSGFFTFDAPIILPTVYEKIPEISRYFKRVYSYSTSKALAPFGCGGVKFSKFCIPQTYYQVFEELWKKKDRKFLTMINTNKLPRRSYQELYTERLKALEYFSKFGEIDLYGFGWDRMPYKVGETWIPAHLTRLYRFVREHQPFVKLFPYEEVIKKVYKGSLNSKYEILSNYTFAICYENMFLQGWVNEKIFDCFLAGTIPIYLGVPDITDYVPENCFIDKRGFSTYEELRSFLKSLSGKEIQSYKENAREYFSSEMFKPFRKESFAALFTQAVEEDVGVRI